MSHNHVALSVRPGVRHRYDDFHVVKMPLLDEEVRGVPSLRMFAQMLVEGYDPSGEPPKPIVL